MHILTKLKKELASAVEEAGYTEEQWKELDEKTKKQYIKDHPNSKYAQKDKPNSNSWTDVYNVFENAPLEELQNLKTREDAENFMKKNSLDPKDENVKKAIDKFMEEPDSEEEDDQDYDDGSMTTKEAKEYWDKYHNSDPVLREYTSYEDWYKDSKENGYIEDEYKPENNSVRPTSYFNGDLEIEYWDEEPSGGYFTDNAAYIGQDIEDNFGDEVDIKFADDGNSNFVSILDKKTGEIYNVVIDDHGIDVMNKDMTDSYTAEETENGYFEPDDLDSVVQFIKKKVSGDEDEVDYTEEDDDYDFTSDEPMTTEEAKKYWKENRTSDPLLEMYDSFEEWYKDSKENGYIED